MGVSGKSAKGFTLVELLVVIAIIGILIGMILPAVQQVREAARRVTCQNNLRQLALAGLNYERSHGVMPDGGLAWWHALSNPPPGGYGWLYQLLPFMEQNNVSETGVTNIQLARKSAIPAYFCPSRRLPTIHANLYALTDYAGSGGTGGEGGPYNGAIMSLLASSSNKVRLKIDEIFDGTSNTIFAGEKFVISNKYAGNSWGDNSGFYTGTGWDSMRFGGRAPKRDVVGSANGSGLHDMFGSAHPSGFQASFCDGSVRMIPYTVDLPTLRNLIHRADGNLVNLNF